MEEKSYPFIPVYDENSKILILGSFPSVKSQESGFFYGHPQNRFWKVMAAVLDWEVPATKEEKIKMLRKNGIALWDVIAECDIVGSSDSSIKNPVPNDLPELLRRVKIEKIFINGKTAQKYYKKYFEKEIDIKAVCLPSTSPANAAWSLDRLIEAWGLIKAE